MKLSSRSSTAVLVRSTSLMSSWQVHRMRSSSDSMYVRMRLQKQTAEREGVDVRLYRVIYDAIEDVEAAMKGMLDPVYEEKVIGHAEVRQTFKASGVGTIAGSYVLDGTFQRGCKVRITREGEQIFEGNACISEDDSRMM